MNRNPDLLLAFFRSPQLAKEFSGPDWRHLLVRARLAGLLPRLRSCLAENELLDDIPAKARTILDEALIQVRLNQTRLRFEANRVERVLAKRNITAVLLKGAAYLLADLPLAERRLVSDLDIMVEQDQLNAAEQALIAAGWKTASLSRHDERYYRAWMHEIPPMWHPDRLFALDLHHAILPLTSQRKPDTAAIFAAASEIEGTRLKVPNHADMVLHGGVHLFDEEIGLGLRDLLDVHDLLSHFGRDPAFWAELSARARLHNLERILYYVLRCGELLLARPVPEQLSLVYKAAAPNGLLGLVMDALLVRALTPPQLNSVEPGRALALWLLYLRSHWLKMPLHLLLPHLLTKAVVRLRKRMRREAARPQSETA